MSTNEVLHLRRVVPNTVKPSPTRNRLETDAIPITIGAAWVTKSSLPKRVKDRADRLDPISVCARIGEFVLGVIGKIFGEIMKYNSNRLSEGFRNE